MVTSLKPWDDCESLPRTPEPDPGATTEDKASSSPLDHSMGLTERGLRWALCRSVREKEGVRLQGTNQEGSCLQQRSRLSRPRHQGWWLSREQKWQGWIRREKNPLYPTDQEAAETELLAV